MMTSEEIWKLYVHYVDAWKPIPDEQRAQIIAETLDESIDYFTPNSKGGPEAIIADIQGFQTKFPGGHFDIEDMSTHHDVALFTWVLIQADGNALLKGHDQIRVAAEGKIAGLITFAPSVAKP